MVVGHSTHEYTDWTNSMLISYAKGARTWERHIEIPYPEGHRQKKVSVYNSLPHQIDEYFKAFHKAVEMCGGPKQSRRLIGANEKKYLEALVRGIYFKKDFPKGHKLTVDDLYLAVPLQKGQFSSKEFMEGDILSEDVKGDCPLLIENVEIDKKQKEKWIKKLYKRGI